MENYNALDAERFIQYEKSVLKSKRLDEVLKLIDRDGIRILDVGGASGMFLKELAKLTKYRIESYNLEPDDFYKSRQVDEKIKFLPGSILESSFNEEFDIVTFGDVLHHLIGKNLGQTRKNQQKALAEIFRLTGKGGYIVFSEEVNNVKLFSLAVYLLSKTANRLKIKIPLLEAGKVVVLFPTQKDVENLINLTNKNKQLKIIKKYFNRWKMPLKWKLTVLMSNVGHINYVIKKY